MSTVLERQGPGSRMCVQRSKTIFREIAWGVIAPESKSAGLYAACVKLE